MPYVAAVFWQGDGAEPRLEEILAEMAPVTRRIGMSDVRGASIRRSRRRVLPV